MSINQEDEYYVTLPSNVSGPNNSISSWTTTLPQTLQLQGQWEVGLAEIIYTNSAYTIPDPLPFYINFDNGKVEEYYVPEGNYDSPSKLIAKLVRVLDSRSRNKREIQKDEEEINYDEGDEAELDPDDDPLIPIADSTTSNPATSTTTANPPTSSTHSSSTKEGHKPSSTGNSGSQSSSHPINPTTIGTSSKNNEKVVQQTTASNSTGANAKADEPKVEKETDAKTLPSQPTAKTKDDQGSTKPAAATQSEEQEIPEDYGQEGDLEADEDQTLQTISVEYPPVHVPVTVNVKDGEFKSASMQIPSDTNVVYTSWGRNEPIPPKRTKFTTVQYTIPKLPDLLPTLTADAAFGVINVKNKTVEETGDVVVAEEDTNSLADDDDDGDDGSLEADPNQFFEPYTTPVKFTYDELANRIQIEIMSSSVSSVKLSKGLMYLLGFDEQMITSNSLSKYSPTTQAGSNALYIFSDISAYSILGDTTTNQLRIVPVTGAYGTTCNSVFNPIRYFGCRTGLISSIQIDIRNEYGELVKFHYGTAVAVLHLRKKH